MSFSTCQNPVKRVLEAFFELTPDNPSIYRLHKVKFLKIAAYFGLLLAISFLPQHKRPHKSHNILTLVQYLIPKWIYCFLPCPLNFMSSHIRIPDLPLWRSGRNKLDKITGLIQGPNQEGHWYEIGQWVPEGRSVTGPEGAVLSTR